MRFLLSIPRRPSAKSRRFGTLCRFHLHRQVDLPMKMEPTESSETSAFSTLMPGRYPKEKALHTEHGESLKSRKLSCI